MKKAVVLLSGGLDSATTLYIAREQGFRCFCLIFDYGQRHKKEIESARKISRSLDCPYWIMKFKLPWGGSSLLDKQISISQQARRQAGKPAGIPPTYVAARNIIFLSFAISYAEVIKAEAVFIGAHSQDYSNYPDCRPEFYRAFRKAISTGTKSGIEGKQVKIKVPLIKEGKSGIIRQAVRLGVPLGLTWSCYRGKNAPCGKCDSCYYRAKGFREAGFKDPAVKIR